MFICRLLFPCILLAVFFVPGLAKRLAPKPVAPVISGGIRYSAGGNGTDQYVVATDLASGHELWRVKVFHVHIDPWMERDVQDVFITDLKLVDNTLFVRDEKSRCYSIDLAGRQVRKRQCASIFSP